MYLQPTVYLDNAATTRVDPQVICAMLPFFCRSFGNVSSRHGMGRQAHRALERARVGLAAGIHGSPEEILFTSGGTEANNLALLGSVAACEQRGKHVIVSAVEHPSVRRAADALERAGVAVTHVPVDSQCRVDPAAVAAALRPDTVLVSVMLVNNEVGTIQPITDIARHLRGRRVLLHSDAVQALGKLPLDVDALGVDLLSLSAHKIHGPKGVGALYVRRGVRLHPRQYGGLQERCCRAGTENVPGIIGFAKAMELAHNSLTETSFRIAKLRDELERRLATRVGGVSIHGRQAPRVCAISNVSFTGVPSDRLLAQLDCLGICASPGSACCSMHRKPSRVLRAMGVSPSAAHSAVRFSLSR